MSPDALFVFGLLAVTVVLFASDWLRPDVVALLVIVALILGGILPVSAVGWRPADHFNRWAVRGR